MMNRIRLLMNAMGPIRQKLPSLAMAGAWLFALGSLVPLLVVLAGGSDSDGTARLVSAQSNGQVHSAFGLAYAGIPGAILMGFEMLAVASAIAVTGLPERLRPYRDWRGWPNVHRAGHAVLIGWAALWTLGLMRLASIEPGLLTVRAGFLAVLLGCTSYRAVCQWPRVKATAALNQSFVDASFSPQTDVAFDPRVILNRSAVRPSATLREINHLPST